MGDILYEKQEVIEYLWLYSHFYSQRLFECEELYEEEKGHLHTPCCFFNWSILLKVLLGI